MPTLMFRPEFACKVADGRKRQTIRPKRKRPIKIGDRLSLRQWEGKAYRSKQIPLREAVCESVSEISIDESFHEFTFVVNGENLNQEQWAKLARDDGFACTTEMLDWFRKTHGLPFSGILIKW